MRIRISHEIKHRFAPPARMLIQNLRLTPSGFDSQYIRGWRISLDIDAALRQGEDAHGNILSSFSHHGEPLEQLNVLASGEVETSDAAGVVRGSVERLPAEMYLRDSPLAHANGALRAFAAKAAAGATGPLDAMHGLMNAVNEALTLATDSAEPGATAAEAFALEKGQARDFAHVFIAGARFLRTPARYVCGYCIGDEDMAPGAHVWAEAHVPVLGWVAFDPTVAICADERYVRTAVGYDGQDTAFVRSSQGGVEDKVDSAIRIEQAGFQTQS
jgi:transglutaminase-like putative cysteine protease